MGEVDVLKRLNQRSEASQFRMEQAGVVVVDSQAADEMAADDHDFLTRLSLPSQPSGVRMEDKGVQVVPMKTSDEVIADQKARALELRDEIAETAIQDLLAQVGQPRIVAGGFIVTNEDSQNSENRQTERPTSSLKETPGARYHAVLSVEQAKRSV